MNVLQLTPKKHTRERFDHAIGRLFDLTYWIVPSGNCEKNIGLYTIKQEVIDDLCEAGYGDYYRLASERPDDVRNSGYRMTYSNGGRSIIVIAFDVVCGWYELFVEYETDANMIHFLLLDPDSCKSSD